MNEHPNAAVARSAYEAVERGDLATFAGHLDDDIVWHESTPGFEGDYHGRHEALALLNRVFEQTGMEVSEVSIRHILADDTHAVVLLETTATLGDRCYSGEYVDVYRLRDGKLTEHWHLAVDPKAEERFFKGGTNMAVIMNTEIAGADASFIEGMRAAGVVDAISKAPGFLSHISGASSSGYRVIEVWESREAHQSWFDSDVAPNLPPGMKPTWEYTDLVLAVPAR